MDEHMAGAYAPGCVHAAVGFEAAPEDEEHGEIEPGRCMACGRFTQGDGVMCGGCSEIEAREIEQFFL